MSKLYFKYRDKECVLNDESYFFKSLSTIIGNYNFYSDNNIFTPAIVKFRRTLKFEEKMLLLVALSPRRISEPFIMPSGNAVNYF